MTTIQLNNEDSLAAQIQCTIEKRIKEYADDLALEMLENYSSQMKRKMANIIASLSIELIQMVSIEMMGTELVIRVQMDLEKGTQK